MSPHIGHIISKEGITVDSTKIEAIVNWKWLENPPKIRRFLGLAEHYHLYSQDFSKIVGPLTKLI